MMVMHATWIVKKKGFRLRGKLTKVSKVIWYKACTRQHKFVKIFTCE